MQSLVIVAHGSHLNPDASTPTYDHADTVREAGVFDEVRTAFWKEEPSFREALRTVQAEEVYVVPLFISEGYFTEQVIPRELRLDGWDEAAWDSDGTSATHATLEATDVIVVPLFVADGYHTQEDIPEDMGLTDDYRTGWETPAEVDGHRIWYAGAVGTEALMADVVLERAADAGAEVGDAVEEVRRRTRVAGSDAGASADAGAGD